MVTPGRPNVGVGGEDLTDPDNDGVVNLIEDATNMNSASPDAQKLPQIETVDVGGVPYPALSFVRLAGGTGTNPYTQGAFVYTVEASTNLVTWTTVGVLVSATPTGDDLTETVVYRPDEAYFASAQAAGGELFLRLRVGRP